MKKTGFLLAIVLLMTAFSPKASAYNLYDEDRPYTTISLNTSETLKYLVHEDFGSTTFSHMNEALYQWNKESGHSLMQRNPTVRHSLSDFGANAARDGLNLVYRKSIPTDNRIAVNLVRWSNSSYLVLESDINFNVSKKFSNGAEAGRWDAYSIFLHESGHTVGLGDIQNPRAYEKDSVMVGNWENRQNSISWRRLRQDDINGLKVLYP